MRVITACCFALLLTLGHAARVSASEGYEDLVKLVKSGVSEKIILDYVRSSPTAYALTVDEILYLSDLGLSAETIKSINAHGGGQSAGAPAPGDAEAPPPADEQALPAALPEMPVESPEQGVVREADAEPPVVTAPPPEAANIATFYDGLAPYGTWINLDGVWCWQPTAVLVNPGWQPYCQRGYWVYTDCGWAWRSSYSWGWAPFHYGRWRQHARYGWLWHPGTVWGPAWVCWRYSEAAIGWAPLPPEAVFDVQLGLCYQGRGVRLEFDFGLIPSCYTFVPVARFCDHDVDRHRFRRDEVPGIFRKATVVENRYRQQDHRIVNAGPPARHVTAATHQELRPLTIVDQHFRAGELIRRLPVSANKLAFYRPPVAPVVRETPGQVVIRRQAHAAERRDATPRESIIGTYQNGAVVRGQQTRGRASLGTAAAGTAPAKLPPPDRRAPEPSRGTAEAALRQRQMEETARQRQLEESVARQRVDRQRQADQLIQRQNETRRLAQEQARQQALAGQQRQAAEAGRQLEERRRAEESARQQANLRRQEETRRTQAVAQQQEQQVRQQALRAQREAEETAARRQLEVRRATETVQQRETPRPAPAVRQPAAPARWQIPVATAPVPSGAFQGYDNGKQTNVDSHRGADSRAPGGRGR